MSRDDSVSIRRPLTPSEVGISGSFHPELLYLIHINSILMITLISPNSNYHVLRRKLTPPPVCLYLQGVTIEALHLGLN